MVKSWSTFRGLIDRKGYTRVYIYRLTRIVLNDGTTVEPPNLTVIVGPNNAGKSRALKEITAKATGTRLAKDVIVKEIGWTIPESLQELRESYNVERHQSIHGGWVLRTLAPELHQEFQVIDNFVGEWPTYFEWLFNHHNREYLRQQNFAESFGRAMVAFLTTEHRLQLVKESASASDEKEASNLLQSLYNAGRATEEHIRELVMRSFNQEIALDFTVLQRLRLRIGRDFATLPLDPRDARSIMSTKEELDEQGDGIRSFVGIVVAMLSIERSLFLIDEPEAFLHPMQAFRIGEFIANQASDEHQIILATHSADVVRGILSAIRDVAILRIDREENRNYFRLLDANRLNELITDPLLSSARVLDGLFYYGAVVVEADSDARFYHSASTRKRTDLDLHFVNADNKQTVPRIMKMYQDMGIRCAGIVDFDALNNHTEFARQLETIGFGDEEQRIALATQNSIAQAVKANSPDERLSNVKQQIGGILNVIDTLTSRTFKTDEEAVSAKERVLRQIESKAHELADSTKAWKLLKQQGRSALPVEIQSQFDQLSKLLTSKGLFINPCGELESMLVEYGIPATTDKRGWIVQALQLLPNLEINEKKYPWKFIAAIHEYLTGVVNQN
jgi:predicted ATPase